MEGGEGVEAVAKVEELRLMRRVFQECRAELGVGVVEIGGGCVV